MQHYFGVHCAFACGKCDGISGGYGAVPGEHCIQRVPVVLLRADSLSGIEGEQGDVRPESAAHLEFPSARCVCQGEYRAGG